MWRIAVCNGNAAEREQLLGYIRRFCEERDMELYAQGAAGWPELPASICRRGNSSGSPIWILRCMGQIPIMGIRIKKYPGKQEKYSGGVDRMTRRDIIQDRQTLVLFFYNRGYASVCAFLRT